MYVEKRIKRFNFCIQFCRFLDDEGSEVKGMNALAASYVGLPNMVNVMIEWLHVAGFRKREIQGIVEEHLKSLVMKHFDPKKADLIFTEEGSVSTCIVHLCVMIHYSHVISIRLSTAFYLQVMGSGKRAYLTHVPRR